MKAMNENLSYYENRFQACRKAVEKLAENRKKESRNKKLELIDSALSTIMTSSIDNHLAAIGEIEDEDVKCQKYRKLIAEINVALNLQISESLFLEQNEKEEYLNAYREYLQEIENIFRYFHNQQTGQNHGNIFLLAFKLTSGETLMHTLFQGKNALCAIFLPSDNNVKEIYTYLPMLTHEVSHNFKFSDTQERNEFVLKYMLECFGRDMLRELFACLPEATFNMFADHDIELLVQEIAGVLHDELTTRYPDFLNEGHLDEFTSVICSLLLDNIPMVFELEETYVQGYHPQDILRKSFLEIYEFCRSYLNIRDSDLPEEGMKQLKDFLEGNNGMNSIPADSVKKLMEEIVLIIIRAVSAQLKDFKGDKWEQFVSSLVDKVTHFSEAMTAMGETVCQENLDEFYEIADQLTGVKINIENIYYICRLYQEIPVKPNAKKLGQKIHSALHERISNLFEQSKFDSSKAYFSTQKSHKLLLELGLLDGDKECRTFLSYYKQIFRHWDENRLVQLLDEHLDVYKEIFADLGMCAIFDFRSWGYFRYMKQLDLFDTRNISRKLNRDRLDTVLRVLHKVNDSGEDALKCAKTNFTADDYERYQKAIMSDQGRYDERYIRVYVGKIAGSGWLQQIRQDKVIQAIGNYYNKGKDSELNPQELWEIFCKKYMDIYQKRKKRYTENGYDSVGCLLEKI